MVVSKELGKIVQLQGHGGKGYIKETKIKNKKRKSGGGGGKKGGGGKGKGERGKGKGERGKGKGERGGGKGCKELQNSDIFVILIIILCRAYVPKPATPVAYPCRAPGAHR